MGEGGPGPSTDEADGVVNLCRAYLDLHQRCVTLDDEIGVLPANDPRRDELWWTLDSIIHQLSPLVQKLAQTPSPNLQALRSKAAVAKLVLRWYEEDVSDFSKEALALALSLADEIANIT